MWYINKIRFSILIVFMAPVGFATPVCQIDGGGGLDSIVDQFALIANTWGNQIEPIAQKIFYILFTTEFLWQVSVKKVFAGDIEKLWVFFFTRVTLCFFFAKYLVNLKIYKDIIEYMISLGGILGNFQISMASGRHYITLGPSEVMSYFNCLAMTIHQVTDKTGSLEFITQKIILAIIQVIIFLALISIAFILIKNLLEAYFILYAGFLLTGFLGSSWTLSFWQRYMSAISHVAVKLFITCLLMGVLSGYVEQWAQLLNSAVDTSSLVAAIFRIFGGILMMLFLIYKIPEWCAQLLAGEVNVFGNEASGKSANHTTHTESANYSNHNFDPSMASKWLDHKSLKPYNQTLSTGDKINGGHNGRPTGQDSNFFK